MITVVVAAGVGVLVASVPAILTMLTTVGAVYLVWLGGSLLAHPSLPTSDTNEFSKSSSWLGWAARGFAISGMNPKALLLFLGILPQFTRLDSAWPISTQITVLGLVQIFNCGIVYSLVGLGSRIVLSTRPNVARRVSQSSGVAMIAIAVFLILEQI